MAAKRASTALDQVLSRRHAARALIALLREPGLTPSALAKKMGPSQPKTGQEMVNHFLVWGLVETKSIPGPFRGEARATYLTPEGEQLARLFHEAEGIAEKAERAVKRRA